MSKKNKCALPSGALERRFGAKIFLKIFLHEKLWIDPYLWRILHEESDGHIFRSLEVTQRSLGVTKGQKSKILKIGQMTYQIEGNCMENRMQ